MAKVKNIDLVRVNINLPVTITNRVKEYAKSMGINVTSAYIMLLNQALDYRHGMDNLPALIELYKNLELNNSKK